MKKSLLFCILIPLTACQADPSGSGSLDSTKRPESLTGLRSFSDCQELQTHLQDLADSAEDLIIQPIPNEAVAFDDSVVAEEGAGAQGSLDSVTIEEGDLVRQLGDRLYIANQQAGLLIYDTSISGQPELLAHVLLPQPPQELQIDETRLAVISSAWLSDQAQTSVIVFDVSDGERPQQISRHSYRGTYESSRRVGEILYMALRNNISVYDWPATEDAVSPCDEVYVPTRMEAAYTVPRIAWDLIGLDLQQPDHAIERVSVMGSWHSHILASPEHFYLVTYLDWPDESEVYLFQISAERASIRPWSRATVPGSIVNQWSIDEYEDVFRIASSTNGFDSGILRNYISTFDVSTAQLRPLGQIDSITPGEWITAARFVADQAFLTTFVTIDPLVTVDLSDPRDPMVQGELEVPGLSRHLIAWNDRIISVGQSNLSCGEVVLTLFDISNLHHPQLIDQMNVSGAIASEALWDHRAVSFYPDLELITLPYLEQNDGSTMGIFEIDRNIGFTELGGFTHRDIFPEKPDRAIPMRRTLKVANHLYTLSDAGISVSSFFDPLALIAEQTYPEISGADFPPHAVIGEYCFPIGMQELAEPDVAVTE